MKYKNGRPRAVTKTGVKKAGEGLGMKYKNGAKSKIVIAEALV